MTSPICAVCTLPCDEFTMQPLGRNGMDVRVCERCDTERPREAHGPERGFEPQGGMLGTLEVRGSKYQKGTFHNPMTLSKTNDGWSGMNTSHDVGPRIRNGKPLHRVARRIAGVKRTRTWEECVELVLAQPWGDNVELYAADARWWVFQEVE